MGWRADRSQLATLWASIEADLHAVLSTVTISSGNREIALDYLDHNELGLAFQTIVTDLADAGAPISPQCIEHLSRAAENMKLENDPDWIRLIS